MPSKNGFNKPKDQILRAKKSARHAKKHIDHNFQPTPTSAQLFMKSKIEKSSAVTNKRHNLTTQTLSNKKMKKIERNLKHLRSNGIESKLLIDLEAQREAEIDIDDDSNESTMKSLKDQTTFVREALWSIVDDAAAGKFAIDSTGEGTTLGHQGFY